MQKAFVALAAAAALIAACDRNAPQARRDTSSATGASQSTTPTTPANLPKPSTAEKREGANPTQGQVDPKEGAQHRDFRQSGDSQGPTSPDTTPRK
jgi:hypothetical protein